MASLLDSMPETPLERLSLWLEDASAAGDLEARACSFVTVGPDRKPSARTVSLKRLTDSVLVFTSALWTRKVQELLANPQVAIHFHWPSLGRQVSVEGQALVGDRELAEELFAERPLSHRLQTLASRQGEPIDDLSLLRSRVRELASERQQALECPIDWGAIIVEPELVEFWQEAPDRIHERVLFERDGQAWATRLIAP